MSPYTLFGKAVGTGAATALAARLATWHDAMVAHKRRLASGRADDECDEECPHSEAGALWAEALDTFGDRAHEFAFLRSSATAGVAAPPVRRQQATSPRQPFGAPTQNQEA